jgi:hypothetical protein
LCNIFENIPQIFMESGNFLIFGKQLKCCRSFVTKLKKGSKRFRLVFSIIIIFYLYVALCPRRVAHVGVRQAAMLGRKDGGWNDGAARQRHVLHAEGEGPAGQQQAQHSDRVQRIVHNEGVS